MKAISHADGKVKRGKDAKNALSDATSVLYFVDEHGSKAIVAGVLYIDGQAAPKGTSHRIELDDGDVLVVDVAATGKEKHRIETKGGVSANGTSK